MKKFNSQHSFLKRIYQSCHLPLYSFSMTISILLLSNSAFSQIADSTLSFSRLKKLSLEELMDIEVITASGSRQKISEAPSTMLVITAKQIEERGYLKLEDVLRDLPGTDLIHTYGHAPTFITFRGMYGDQNNRILFMIDGIEENSIMGGFEMSGPAYSLHNVERIEIIWGPGSALYGANAYSAVINLITKNGETMNPAGSRTGAFYYQKGYGTFNTSVENVMLGMKKSNLPKGATIDFVLSGSLYKTDGPLFSSRHPQYNNSYINNAWSFNGQVSYTLKNFKTTFGARAFQTSGGVGELAVSPTNIFGLPSQGNQNSGYGGIIQSDFNGEKASYGEIFARTAFLHSEFTPKLPNRKTGSKLTIIGKVQYRETGISDKSYVYINFPGTGIVSRSIFAYDANRIKGEISVNYIFTEYHTISAGIQYSQDNLERGFRGVIPDGKFSIIENIPVTDIYATFKPRDYAIRNNLGTYLQYVLNTNFLRKTNVTIGGRYDNNSIYGTTINPRIGIINQPHEKITLKLLYGSAFRAPTNFELHTTIATKIANPDLKPEKIQTFEANIIYTPIKVLSVQINLFQNELTDIIIPDVLVAGGYTQNQNVGTASVKGLETKLNFIPMESLSAFVNFTYQEGTQNNGTTISDIPNIAKVKGNAGVSIHLADLFTISLIENWVGERSVPATNPLGKVDEYFITNLVITTNKLFKNKVSAGLTINNLLNHTYYDPGIGEADGNFYPTVYDQPGINVLFKITATIF